ncbi:unnamed protein product [Echinostoma caproni]|uniref:Secreted protein n=1 Tax=Echinostoma caproni TaxID=27848 RepID=A0A183B0E1_9TREM|nr:unnamed protein product [Echinostoma caproni]
MILDSSNLSIYTLYLFDLCLTTQESPFLFGGPLAESTSGPFRAPSLDQNANDRATDNCRRLNRDPVSGGIFTAYVVI